MAQSTAFNCKMAFAFFAFLTVAACRNTNDEIPFPTKETGFMQPVSKPLHFSTPKKMNWPVTPARIKPIIKKLDLAKLPERIFDSTGFLPFSKKPAEVSFNFDKLPDTAFNYNDLPSKTLQFETSLLEPPKTVKIGRPYLKNGASSFLYEFGEPFTGNDISCVFEDRKGFVWIAAPQALYRYDGENLAKYLQGRFEYPIYSILEDDRGQIWASTGGNGIFVINTRAGIVKHLAMAQGLGHNNIVRMLLDNSGRIWATFGGGLHDELGVDVIDQNSLTIKHIGTKQGLSKEVTAGIIQDRQNNIWIASLFGGLNIIDLKSSRIKYLGKKQGLNTDTLTLLLRDAGNKIWVAGLLGEMNRLDMDHGTILQFGQDQGLHKNMKWALTRQNNGNIWMGTYSLKAPANGVNIFDSTTGGIKIITDANDLSGNEIECLLTDSRGQIWISTGGGLNLAGAGGHFIEHHGKIEVSSLSEDHKKKIWIAPLLNSGIEIWDRPTGKIKLLTTAQGLGSIDVQDITAYEGKLVILSYGGMDIIDSSQKTIAHYSKQQGLSADSIVAEAKDNLGQIWLGENSMDGVDILNTVKSTVLHIGKEQGLKDSAISGIAQDNLGQIWLSANKGGIDVIDPGKQTIKYFDSLPGINERYNRVFLRDDLGNLWIGTAKGVYVVDAANDSFKFFSKLNGLIGDRILSLHHYGGRIFIGTTAGISILTPPHLSQQKKWEVESFGKGQGINKLVNTFSSDCITADGQFLWGDKGITVLNYKEDNKESPPATYITGIDLLSELQYFADKPWTQLSGKDTLWGPAKDTFYLNGQLPANNSFSYERKIKWDSIRAPYNMPSNLRLPYDHNYLQFHFTQINAGNRDTIWYQYILEGIDKKWSDITTNASSENYLNLPTGNYTFKISGRLFNKPWSQPAEFSFSIMPPWWKSIWAYLLYVIIFVALVWSFVRYRSRRLIQENLLLERKVLQRTTELKQSLEELKETQAQLIQREKMASLGELTAGIAHEIQNPLNFVNNFSEVNTELIDELKNELVAGNNEEAIAIAENIKDNEQKIAHHGKRADSIVKGMLQHSRTSSGQKEPTDINALADEYLRLAYHGLRAKDKTFNATMKTDFDESIGKINVVSQDIGRVFMNLFTNAFYSITQKPPYPPEGGTKYEPTVLVSTRKIGLPSGAGGVEIRVWDNGMGIPQKVLDKIYQPFFTTKPVGQGTGLGLSLSYDTIVKVHGGQMYVETKEGEFAEFIIRLPV